MSISESRSKAGRVCEIERDSSLKRAMSAGLSREGNSGPIVTKCHIL